MFFRVDVGIDLYNFVKFTFLNSPINYLNNKEKIRNKKEEKLCFGFAKTCINIAALRHTDFIIYSFLFIIL